MVKDFVFPLQGAQVQFLHAVWLKLNFKNKKKIQPSQVIARRSSAYEARTKGLKDFPSQMLSSDGSSFISVLPWLL